MLPATAHEVLELSGQPSVRIDKIVALIERDAILAASVLKLANSPLLGGRVQILSVGRAVTQIGLRRVRDLLFAIVRKAVFPPSGHRALHQKVFGESVAVACACDKLGYLFKNHGEQRFLYGLFHNVGKGAVLNTVSELQHGGIGAHVSEEEVVSLVERHYVRAGGLVAHRWRLPEPFHDAITLHRHPELAIDDGVFIEVPLITHFARLICATYGIGFEAGQENIFESPYLIKMDGLSPADIDEAAHTIRLMADGMRAGMAG